jgi:hypothetical protein
VLGTLGTTLVRSGELNRALEVFEAGFMRSRRTLGPKHPHTVRMRHNIDLVREAMADQES